MKTQHTDSTTSDYAVDVYVDLVAGRLVIVDQSSGDPEINKVSAERIMWRVFRQNQERFRKGEVPPSILVYVEEAHNLLPFGTDTDLTNVWCDGRRVFSQRATTPLAIAPERLGVAALVRARYPYLTNIQVMRRLMDTSGRRCGGNLVWRDMLVNAEAAVGGICFVNTDWHGPNQIIFSTGWPDEVEETYTVVATGGNGPLTYQWSSNPSTGPSATYRFAKLPGQDYSVPISVTIRDTGSNNPGRTWTLVVGVYDRSNCGESGENC